ncbi:MAG: penicillin-binding transpeptidase domain-containing protein [Oligoflexales bacterium]
MRFTFGKVCIFVLATLGPCAGCEQSSAVDGVESKEEAAVKKDPVPKNLQTLQEDWVTFPNSKSMYNLVPQVQNQIQEFITRRSNPVAASVVIDVATGKILAMTQGKLPDEWGGATHTALHEGFPTASLFKTVVAAAAFEVAGVSPHEPIGLYGGCANVHPKGYWMSSTRGGRANNMDLQRAYGMSCNGFFAKLAVNRIGLGVIQDMAARFGWNGYPVKTDFQMPPSPIKIPNPRTSSVHTIGRFAAGFGSVGTSPAHMAWQMLAIARDGEAIPLRMFSDDRLTDHDPIRIIQPRTAKTIREIMFATTHGGTASSTFRHRRYRKLREIVGGKTGTLNGHSPTGVVTWFAGMMPLDNPRVVVASVVVLEDLWHFKASDLAAESFLAYYDYMQRSNNVSQLKKGESERVPLSLR